MAGNNLSNSGFESDPVSGTTNLPGWTPYGGNTYGETSLSNAYSGTNYFKVYQAFTGSINYSGIYQDYISGPAASYTADGWAYTAAGDTLAGQNVAWIEVTFRDALGNILALYRSTQITTNIIAAGLFPKNTWNDLMVTNQYNPVTYQITNTVTTLVAPAGTFFLRYQIVFQGDVNSSGGSVYFDNMSLIPAGGAPYGSLNIVWSDEFNATAINTNIWTYDLGNGGSNPGWGNSEMEYYTSRTSNAYLSNGVLHIAAKQESMGGFNYTSARLKSQGLFASQYGRIEWRAELPPGVGCWPALWLLGTNISTINWPGCGEIDVVENTGGNPIMVQGSLHSGSDSTGIYNFTDGNTVTNFHTYTLDWTTNAFLYYVDGHLYQTQTSWGSSTTNVFPFPFNQPFFLIMNLAIGGSYLGYPTTNAINAGTVFPAEMLVDYVRIYKLTDPLRLAFKKSGSNYLLSWPSNIVCHLLMQTNLTSAGVSTNWLPVATVTNQLQINPSAGSFFYRLVTP